jgi:beta-N-acetylhexosaminidase
MASSLIPVSIADLSLREKAAQVVMPRIGSNMPPPVRVSEDFDRVEELLSRCPVGGLMMFNGSLPEMPEALSRLQRNSRVPLLVATDMERGLGQQVRGATVFPHAMAYGQVEDAPEETLERVMRMQAREALRAGIHITFGPVADVNRNPRNPIIATRAFGSEAANVSRLVRAYIRGCRAEGLLTTAKHFPGHGSTSVDSHAELPVVSDERALLEQIDLPPFQAAIDEGVDLMMTAHVVFPALGDPANPATLSPAILQRLLREEMGFDGAVITDSLLMAAIKEAAGGAQAASLIAAGVDILLDHSDPIAAVDELERAVESGRLSEERLNDAVRRVFALKERLARRFGLDYFTHPADSIPAEEPDAAARLAEDVARAAVRVEPVTARLALRADERLVTILLKPHRTRLEPPEQPLGEAVRRTFPLGEYIEIGPGEAPGVYASAMEKALAADRVLLAMVIKPAAWHAFGLLEEQHRFAEELTISRDVIIASLGTPHALDVYPRADVRICTFSDIEASQRALVDVIARS